MSETMVRSVVFVGMLLAAAGCSKKVKMTADAIEKSTAGIVQQGDRGTSTWIVGPDGAVNALLKGADGKPPTGTVTGQVTFANPNGGTPTTVPLDYDSKTGVVSAKGPKLDADLTPVTYALTVDGKPWNGALDVPRAGTQDLADNAKLQAAANIASSTVGPNGGVVQIVGPDRVEVVANKTNGEVRAYLLDPNNKPIDPGDRKITIALQGDQPETVVLEPDPQAHYVIGHVRTRVDPVNVTVAVNEHGVTHDVSSGGNRAKSSSSGLPRRAYICSQSTHGRDPARSSRCTASITTVRSSLVRPASSSEARPSWSVHRALWLVAVRSSSAVPAT